MADKAGLTDLIVKQTHSCYRGDREHCHDWGYGCGTCPACELRQAGFYAWKNQAGYEGRLAPDPKLAAAVTEN